MGLDQNVRYFILCWTGAIPKRILMSITFITNKENIKKKIKQMKIA